MNKFPHKQAQGIVDISHKTPTKRIAHAQAVIRFSENGFKTFIENGSPKGDIIEAAKVAGVMAAKKTPDIIPFCHPLNLSKVSLSLDVDHHLFSVTVNTEVQCTGQTGVEMEALHAASAAALTVYDMMKWADKSIMISDLCLLKKSGGQSGEYIRNNE